MCCVSCATSNIATQCTAWIHLKDQSKKKWNQNNFTKNMKWWTPFIRLLAYSYHFLALYLSPWSLPLNLFLSFFAFLCATTKLSYVQFTKPQMCALWLCSSVPNNNKFLLLNTKMFQFILLYFFLLLPPISLFKNVVFKLNVWFLRCRMETSWFFLAPEQ